MHFYFKTDILVYISLCTLSTIICLYSIITIYIWVLLSIVISFTNHYIIVMLANHTT